MAPADHTKGGIRVSKGRHNAVSALMIVLMLTIPPLGMLVLKLDRSVVI